MPGDTICLLQVRLLSFSRESPPITLMSSCIAGTDHCSASTHFIAVTTPYTNTRLFPLGTDGFHLKIKYARGQKHVSAVEFYSYHLQVRQGGDNFLMKSRRLKQQYAYDQFCKVDGLRPRWIETHQKQIRAEKYSDAMDAIDNDDAMNAGRRIVLPASVYGSPSISGCDVHCVALWQTITVHNVHMQPGLACYQSLALPWGVGQRSTRPHRPCLRHQATATSEGPLQASRSWKGRRLHRSASTPEMRPSTCSHSSDSG